MPTLASRRSILMGHAKDSAQLRPPGAIGEYEFDDICNRCGDCAVACEENIIVFGARKLPEIDLSKGGCTFCSDCIEACDTGALTADIQWPWIAQIADSCLAVSGVQCRACQDMCDQSALRIQLRVGGYAIPEIQTEACNGCGFCIAPCPTGAITLSKRSPTPELRQC